MSLLLGAQLEDKACSGPACLFGLVLRAHSQSSFAQPFALPTHWPSNQAPILYLSLQARQGLQSLHFAPELYSCPIQPKPALWRVSTPKGSTIPPFVPASGREVVDMSPNPSLSPSLSVSVSVSVSLSLCLCATGKGLKRNVTAHVLPNCATGTMAFQPKSLMLKVKRLPGFP